MNTQVNTNNTKETTAKVYKTFIDKIKDIDINVKVNIKEIVDKIGQYSLEAITSMPTTEAAELLQEIACSSIKSAIIAAVTKNTILTPLYNANSKNDQKYAMDWFKLTSDTITELLNYKYIVCKKYDSTDGKYGFFYTDKYSVDIFYTDNIYRLFEFLQYITEFNIYFEDKMPGGGFCCYNKCNEINIPLHHIIKGTNEYPKF